MRIFITGSTGFIGRNLVEHYSDKEVYAYNRGSIKLELSMFKPDLIINCAAEIYNPNLMLDSNVMLVKNCLDWLQMNPSTRMIQIGSSSEYGPVPHASAETDRINPIDMYQATKGMATILCQGHARSYQHDIRIIRPYSVYGKYEKPHRLFPRLWKAFMLDQPMTLFDGQHDFIHIEDFVRGVDIIASSTDAPTGDIINIGSGCQYGNFEILDLFENITGKKAPVTRMETMAKKFESEVWMCNTTYAWEKYGFRCQHDVVSGIKRFIETANYQPEVA